MINRRQLARIVSVSILILLMCIMIAHAFIPHDHSEALFGNGTYAFLHGADRKLIFLIFSFLILCVVSRQTTFEKIPLQLLRCHARMFLEGRHNTLKIHSPLFQGLQRGILNPKLH
mgnify:CR=1 FL=1